MTPPPLPPLTLFRKHIRFGSQLVMKHQTNIRWLFPLRKDILYWIEAINLSPVSLFVKPFCLFRLFTTVYTQPRLSRWYIAFCNADSNHFLDFCITVKVVKIISIISAQFVPNTRRFFSLPDPVRFSAEKNWATGNPKYWVHIIPFD